MDDSYTINVSEDGLNYLGDVMLSSSYEVTISYDESNVHPDFKCTGSEAFGTAGESDLFLNVVFICAFTGKKQKKDTKIPSNDSCCL